MTDSPLFCATGMNFTGVLLAQRLRKIHPSSTVAILKCRSCIFID